jgi:hypothetical protein
VWSQFAVEDRDLCPEVGVGGAADDPGRGKALRI